MNRIGVAVIGASMRATGIFQYLKDNPQEGFIAGIYDLIPTRSRWMLDKYGCTDAVVYESLEHAVSDKSVQGVFVVTADYAHVEPSIAALKAGKHLFLDKPMALTLADCDAIIKAAKDAPGVSYLGMNLRHTPVHEALHNLLEEGSFGKLLTVEANEYYYGGMTYFRRWNRLEKYSGGLWITKASHDFDLLNWFAGAKPVRVYATCSLSYFKPKPEAGEYCRQCSIKETCPIPQQYDPQCWDVQEFWEPLARLTEEATGQKRDLCVFNSDKDTFDNGMAIVEYDNDVRAAYTINMVSAWSTRQMSLVGTEGQAEGDYREGLITFRKRHDAYRKVTHDVRDLIKGTHLGADIKLMRDIFHCWRTNQKPRSNFADGRLSIKVALAARESCLRQQVITLDSGVAGATQGK